MERHDNDTPPSPGAPPWRRKLVLLLLLVVAVSIGARTYLAREKPAPQPAATAPNALLPRQPPSEQPPEEESRTRKLLPFVTEGGLAMLLGIALGVATRAVAKLALVVIAVFFVVIQFLAFKGLLTVDWSALEHYVLNIPAAAGLGKIVQYKLPSAGALVLGYSLGLKRG